MRFHMARFESCRYGACRSSERSRSDEARKPALRCLLAVLVFSVLGMAQDVNVHIDPRPANPPATDDKNGPKSALPEIKNHGKPGTIVDVNLVLVNVTVTDDWNRIVTGLDKENFAVMEGSELQVVKHFSSEDAPISLGVIFDMSGSMNDKIEKAREAVIEFFKTANPQDEFFMITFMVKEADVQIYAIGIFSAAASQPEEIAGPALLTEISQVTGGRMFTINNPNELADVATKIGIELRNQYVLGYRPNNKVKDGHWRKIKVRLIPPKGLPHLNVYARTGYYAPSQ